MVYYECIKYYNIKGFVIYMNKTTDKEVISKLEQSISSNALIRAELEEVMIETFLPNRTITEKAIINELGQYGVGTLYDLYDYGITNLKDLNGVGEVRYQNLLASISNELDRIHRIYEIVQNLNFSIDATKVNELTNVSIGHLFNTLFDREVSAFDDFDNFNIYDGILNEDLNAIVNKPYMTIANHISIFRLYELAETLTANDIVDLNGFDSNE